VLGQEREREKAEREARRLEREELARTDPQAALNIPEEVPTCKERPSSFVLQYIDVFMQIRQ